jgi:class 3 adenylate cyclase/tetratricopeptide (TPR) repeat protein
MRCPSCGVDNSEGMNFCGRCGTKLSHVCPQCRLENPPGFAFCGKCGTSLTGQTLAPQPRTLAPRLKTPRSYTPHHLAERILQSQVALEGERKQVTVLFADLKGSMELLADRDPEEVWQLLDPVLERMMDAVHRYEGTVNQVMGDGIMALFGAPLAHEDHAVRACYAGLAMQEAIRRYSDEVRRAHGIEVQIRVGLNSGEVVVRAIGNDLHMDYSAIGQTTHLAARMEQLAPPGSIRLTAETLRLAEGLIQVKPVGPVPVKGLADPVELFELVGAGPSRTRLQAFAARRLTRFVGRQAELEALRQTLEQAGAGHGQVVGIIGEPGVGKTRLIYEFTHSHRTHDWLLLESSAVSYGKDTSYLPIIDLLKAYFQLEERDDGRRICEKVTGKLLTLDAALGPTLPAFLALLDVPVEDSQWQALDPFQRRQRTLDALNRLLLRESEVQPLLLIVENLHWIDAETQAVQDSLIESLQTARILLLVSYRPEYQHGWGDKTFYTQLRLDPLPRESTEELLDALLGGDVGLTPLKQLLIERTGGNPFFLEESVWTLVETKVLVGEQGAYRLNKAPQSIQVPATVQAVLATRIDRLPSEEKRLLQAASVIGRDVPFVLLQAIAEMPEEAIRHGLVHLQAAEFLYETSLFPGPEYTFKHALTHEVAYGSLVERRRLAYHRAVGSTLEKLSAGRTDEVLEVLAYHFGRSTEDEKAVDYAILAAEKAQRRWANTEALTHFEAALKRLAAMSDTEANRLRRIDAVLKQAEVKFALGRHADHIQALEGIRDLVEGAADPRRRATWYYWMGFLHSFIGSRPEVAISYCREALAIAEACGLEELQAFAESCLAQVYVFVGDLHGAVAAGEHALATFEARGNVWWACRTLWHLSSAANIQGEWQQSLRYCQRALAHGEAVNDLRLKVVARQRTGSAYILQGDPKAGLRWCEGALALSPIPFDAAMIRAVRGHGLVKAGETEAGTAALAAAVAWFDQSRLPYTRSLFALHLGEAYLRQGERASARAVLEEVLATSREGGYRYLEGVAGRLLGEVLVSEDSAAAAGHLEAAVRILEEVGARNQFAKVLVAQAGLCQATNDPAGARQLLERALALFKALGTLDEPPRVRAALAALQDNLPA